jgi:hypothetical protein
MDREWTDKRMDDFAGGVNRRFDEVDTRFDRVERRFDRFEDQIEKQFGKVDSRFGKVEADTKEGFAKNEAAIASLGEKMDKMSRKLMSGMFTVVLAVILKLFVA